MSIDSLMGFLHISVQRQTFDAPPTDEPVAEASIDGGMVRLVVESGQQPLATGDSGLVSFDGELGEGWWALKRLAESRRLLWQGKADETLALSKDCQLHQAQCFCQYLQKHQHRIVNYDYYQDEGISSIGSGAVESTVKQIDRSLEISGARWEAEHVPNVLAHRCAYLNNML